MDMSSIMTLSYLVFPTGTPAPGTPSAVLPVADGEPLILSAPFNVAGPGNPPAYAFIFWDADSQLYQVQESGGVPDPQQTVNFDAPTDQAFAAAAWYVPTGGPGGGGTGVTAWAFSLNQQTALPNSPIASVSPAFAQQSANTVSTTASNQPVIISASPLVGGYGRFNSWLQFSGNGAVNGSILTVPAGGASEAIAFYSIPVPDPCAGIREELDNISPADFSSLADFFQVWRELHQQLYTCEQQYGELP
jgi:hypothetical protein